MSIRLCAYAVFVPEQQLRMHRLLVVLEEIILYLVVVSPNKLVFIILKYISSYTFTGSVWCCQKGWKTHLRCQKTNRNYIIFQLNYSALINEISMEESSKYGPIAIIMSCNKWVCSLWCKRYLAVDFVLQ